MPLVSDTDRAALLGGYLLKQQGVAPPKQGAPPPATGASAGIQDLTQAAAGQQLTGLQDVLTPSPPQAAAPPFSPSESLSASVGAAAQLKGGINQIRQLPRQLGEVEGMAGAMPPADAARLGSAPGAATEQTRGILSQAWNVGLNALDIAGSQLGRLHQLETHTALAAAQGSQWDDAAQQGLIGAAYGLHNPRYVNFNDVLTALGVEPGVIYKGAGILPQWDERSMLGFAADMILDPVNWITTGANKAYGLLTKTGKWLTKPGREALMAMEHAGVLSENPEIRSFLAARGRHDLVDALEHIAPAAKEILDSPIPAVLTKHRPALRKVFDAVSEEVAAAAKTGKLGYPDPADPSVFREIRHFDPLLTEAHQNKLADLAASDPKLAKAYTDPGGVHFAGQSIPGLSEATAAIPGALRSGAAKAGGATERAGRRLAVEGLRTVGQFIERKPAQLEKAVDVVGSALNTIWRLPPRFARFLTTDYYAKSRQAEYLLREQGEQIFRGISTADAEAITKAIDSRTLPEFLEKNPDLRETVDALNRAQDSLWNAQVARGLQSTAGKRDNYIYHSYKNDARFRQLITESQIGQPGAAAPRPGIRTARSYDPSTYQRVYDTLAEAEADGLQPEYDIRKLFAMRQVNGWRAVIAHDFLRGTVEKFATLIKPALLATGETLNPEEVINLTARAAGETMHKPDRMAELIEMGAVDITDPTVAGPVAQRLAEEGKVPLHILDRLPDDMARQFFLERFRLAAQRGGEKELTNVQAKYRAYERLWPKGEARDVLGDTFGLPKLAPIDGKYVTVPIELAPGSRVMATLPERIARKLKEIQQGGVFNSEAGGPLRDILRTYDKFLLNPFRKITTAPRPAFHIRNAVSNVLQSGMDIGAAILNPELHATATAILRGQAGPPIRTALGEIISREQTMGEFIRYGGANTFYKRANITAAGAGAQLAEDFVASHGAWRYVNPVYIGRTVGTAIENEARLAHFLALRRDGLAAPAAMERVLKFLFDYDQLTPVERDGFRRFFPFWCVPDDTEILARCGWKNCDALAVGEEVLTYNVERDELEWQPCTDKAIFHHDEDLTTFTTDRRKLRFTPEHRWPVFDYAGRRSLVPGTELNTGHKFIMTAEYRGRDSILTPEQATLLGWLVTDGTWRFRGNHVEAGIYQSPKKFLDEVRLVAGGHESKPHPQTGTIRVAVLKERLEPLRAYLDKDALVKVVTRLSREAAEAMYAAMYRADGTTSLKRKADFFASTHTGVRHAFGVLATMLGKRLHENGRGFYISNERRMFVAYGKRGKAHYKGRVWCPVTPNATWVMRQGTTIMLTGNTWQKKNLSLQTSQLVSNPRTANGYYRFFQSFQTEKNPEKVYLQRDLFPQFLRNQLAVSAGEGRAPQMSRWIMGFDLPVRDLNRLWNGDLSSTFQNEWLNNVGPIPGAGEALYAMMGAEEGDKDVQRGIDAGAPAYRALALTRRLPGLGPLADWLDVHEGFDGQGRTIIIANPAKVKALAVLTAMDSPIRDISRFMESSDSPISALVRLFTGVRFEEMNPEAERRRHLKSAYNRAEQYLGAKARDLKTYHTKSGVEPGRELERGPAPALKPTGTDQ